MFYGRGMVGEQIENWHSVHIRYPNGNVTYGTVVYTGTYLTPSSPTWYPSFKKSSTAEQANTGISMNGPPRSSTFQSFAIPTTIVKAHTQHRIIDTVRWSCCRIDIFEKNYPSELKLYSVSRYSGCYSVRRVRFRDYQTHARQSWRSHGFLRRNAPLHTFQAI